MDYRNAKWITAIKEIIKNESTVKYNLIDFIFQFINIFIIISLYQFEAAKQIASELLNDQDKKVLMLIKEKEIIKKISWDLVKNQNLM